ncbi:membrane protein [Bacteroidia bacterium]|nr:membrane protein [Bacteroidia bacterium]
MKRLIFIFAALTLVVGLLRAQGTLSEDAKISLLTCSPSEEASFTVYGHTAIRVLDPVRKIDYIFNWGIFDFNKPNFTYRFAKGETDYKLGITTYDYFLAEYQMRGSGMTEQVLNLNTDEKARIWDALVENARPENVEYRYNFFFDNCATRPLAIIEKVVDGTLTYHNSAEPQTFRQLINYCMRNKPWLIFGTELALGSPTDRIATPHEELFLPLYLEAAFDMATIVDAEGLERPLVVQTNILAEDAPDRIEKTLFTPLVASLFFLVIILVITCLEWRKKKYFRFFDGILFFVTGLAGCTIFFLAFVSVHPATWPNWLILWLHPFHLIGAVLIAVKKLHKAATAYHGINFVLLTLMLIGWYFIPQTFNLAFLPLVVALWLRSGSALFCAKVNKQA